MITFSDLALQPGFEIDGILKITGDKTFEIREASGRRVELEVDDPAKFAEVRAMALVQMSARLSIRADGTLSITVGIF